VSIPEPRVGVPDQSLSRTRARLSQPAHHNVGPFWPPVCQRIVAAFQPVLLSRTPSEMSAADHMLVVMTMIFLVENRDQFLIGMSGTASSD
jgi:hypothetical protein